MSAPNPDRDEALARLLAGESSPAEREALGRWLAEHPEEAAAFRLMQQTAGRMARSGSPIDIDRAWRRVSHRLQDTDARRPVGAHARWRPILAFAAGLALVTLGGLWAWQRAAQPPALAYSAPPGVPQVIPFDGGRMVLAPRSRLVARHRAGARPEEVRLEGEAYFEVSHDADRPFTVRVGETVITDLGTTFSVRGHPGASVEVEVLEGSVLLQTPGGASLVVEGGQAGRVEAGIPLRADLSSSSPPAWIEGRLEFQDAPMSEVQTQLRHWYGLELRLGDSTLAGRHVTASFQGDPIGRVLQVIALSLGGVVEQRGDTAVLRLNGDPALR